jgi:hypothetical protein
MIRIRRSLNFKKLLLVMGMMMKMETCPTWKTMKLWMTSRSIPRKMSRRKTTRTPFRMIKKILKRLLKARI